MYVNRHNRPDIDAAFNVVGHSPMDHQERNDSTLMFPTWDTFLVASADEFWSVVRVDNFNRESVSDSLVSSHLQQSVASTKAVRLNADCGPSSPNYHQVYSSGDRLSLGMLDLV